MSTILKDKWNKIVLLEIHSQYSDPERKVFQYLCKNYVLERIIEANSVSYSIFYQPKMLWVTDNLEPIYNSFEDPYNCKRVSRLYKRTGTFSSYSNPETAQYSEGIYGRIGKLHNKTGKIKVSAWIYLKENTKANFCLSFHKTNGEQYLWKNAQIDYTKYNQWQFVEIETQIPQTESEEDELKCYLNVVEGQEGYIDDIKVTIEQK